MTSAILNLFKEQLTTELTQLAHTRSHLNLISNKPDPGVAFPYWYFERIEQFDRALIDSAILDGFDDEKIDAYHISDDECDVRFFQFKNPLTQKKGIDDAAVDGILNTVDLFLNSSRRKTGLDEVFKEIRSAIRTSYKIVFVTSGTGLAPRQKTRIEAKLALWNGPNRHAFSYEVIDLVALSDKLYVQNLPTINSKLELKLDTPPYQTKINNHKSLVCHVDGTSLVDAYVLFGEKLLQQNIRNSEGSSSANRAIFETATSPDSENFYFYNNGVTIICDDWDYDQPSWRLSIVRPQVVNGGQTLRQISAAAEEGKLKGNVKVLIRVISIGTDREFSGNVAVNLNNQTVVRSSFLKSNHPFFIQMQQSLLPLGWYFERKSGDWGNLTPDERTDLISKISDEENIIQIQTGCQAYCAVYLQDIDLAKRNPKNIFISKRNGGRFEDVASADLTASKMILSYQLHKTVDGYLKTIRDIRRNVDKKQQQKDLGKLLFTRTPPSFIEFKKMLPQAGIFIAALVSCLVDVSADLPNESDLRKKIVKAILLTYASGNNVEGAWATLLKSPSFYASVKKKLVRKVVAPI